MGIYYLGEDWFSAASSFRQAYSQSLGRVGMHPQKSIAAGDACGDKCVGTEKAGKSLNAICSCLPVCATDHAHRKYRIRL
jgi:hypothetical protein